MTVYLMMNGEKVELQSIVASIEDDKNEWILTPEQEANWAQIRGNSSKIPTGFPIAKRNESLSLVPYIFSIEIYDNEARRMRPICVFYEMKSIYYQYWKKSQDTNVQIPKHCNYMYVQLRNGDDGGCKPLDGKDYNIKLGNQTSFGITCPIDGPRTYGYKIGKGGDPNNTNIPTPGGITYFYFNNEEYKDLTPNTSNTLSTKIGIYNGPILTNRNKQVYPLPETIVGQKSSTNSRAYGSNGIIRVYFRYDRYV